MLNIRQKPVWFPFRMKDIFKEITSFSAIAFPPSKVSDVFCFADSSVRRGGRLEFWSLYLLGGGVIAPRGLDVFCAHVKRLPAPSGLRAQSHG